MKFVHLSRWVLYPAIKCQNVNVLMTVISCKSFRIKEIHCDQNACKAFGIQSGRGFADVAPGFVNRLIHSANG